jgi:hypothetical protein
MGTIRTDHASHSTSTEVASRLAMGATIRTADAAAIASWYQSPAGNGAILASFASGCDVDAGDLAYAVAREWALTSDPGQRAELDALGRWVHATASRGHWSACNPFECTDPHCQPLN